MDVAQHELESLKTLPVINFFVILHIVHVGRSVVVKVIQLGLWTSIVRFYRDEENASVPW